jgi:hypothetical protein
VAIFCLLAVLFNLYMGLQMGGFAMEFPLFIVLTVVFGTLWFYLRGREQHLQ